jgi:hypothetical protein
MLAIGLAIGLRWQTSPLGLLAGLTIVLALRSNGLPAGGLPSGRPGASQRLRIVV